MRINRDHWDLNKLFAERSTFKACVSSEITAYRNWLSAYFQAVTLIEVSGRYLVDCVTLTSLFVGQIHTPLICTELKCTFSAPHFLSRQFNVLLVSFSSDISNKVIYP